MRLIDADDFFERMKNDTDLCAEMEMCGEEALKKYLDLQPTAYDIGTVVENKDNIVQLVNTFAKTMIEAFKNLKIEDINMFQLGYNKALDDFAEACDNQFTTMYGQRYVDMRDIVNIAEELKAGVTSEAYNQ